MALSSRMMAPITDCSDASSNSISKILRVLDGRLGQRFFLGPVAARYRPATLPGSDTSNHVGYNRPTTCDPDAVADSRRPTVRRQHDPAFSASTCPALFSCPSSPGMQAKTRRIAHMHSCDYWYSDYWYT